MSRRNDDDVILHGERVLLRQWQRRDALAQDSWPAYTDAFSGLWNLPRAVALGEDDDDYSFNFTAVPRRIWAIDNDRHQLIGRLSLREIKPVEGSARLGISIGASYVSQGLGTEALCTFLDYFFNDLGFAHMVLDVAAVNIRAVRCYERLGFRHVGHDWRDARYDPSLRLLDDPRYADYLRFFQRSRHGTFVLFYEMELSRDQWRRCAPHITARERAS
ncbi:MAG: GNAT family N-acetyltransferase [Chloroflexaceae bacterium]|jgi:RimJ/RimL family protein N-acetyltransferase|nr:GNAT family N-acetyltransferase [Chloroflexaceae bacterium]